MEELQAKHELDTPVGRSRSKWTLQPMDTSNYLVKNGAYSARSMTMKLHTHIDWLRLMVHLLRQIYWAIVSEEGRQAGGSKEIKCLKEDLSGIPCTIDEIDCWIAAQDLSSCDTQHTDELRKLLDKELKEVCLDFLRVSQNPDVTLFLRNMLSEFPPWTICVSDVHGIIYNISKHLQGKREMPSEVPEWTCVDIKCLELQRREKISKDAFLSMIERGPVQIRCSPNQEFLELNVTPYFGSSYFTRVKWHTSVRHKLVQLLLFVDWSVMEGHGDFSVTLQPQEVKDPVCYVSRTGGGTSDIIPSYVGRIRPVSTLKKRRCIRLLTGNRGFRLLDATRRRRHRRRLRAPPPLWIYDTGASVSVTGDLSLLRGVHDAAEICSRGVSGAELVSTKCGRVAGAVSLPGVRYFPGAKANLICGGLFGSLGCEIIQNAKGCTIMKGGQVIGGGRLLPNRTYSVDYLDDKLLGGTICSGCRH